MNRIILRNIIIALIGTAVIFVLYVIGKEYPISRTKPDVVQDTRSVYSSQKLGISFSYPKNYILQETDRSTGMRYRYEIILMQDTEENRRLLADPQSVPPREGPPVINIGVFQNNLDGQDAETWIRGTSFSNFKLSDGNLAETALGGEKAFKYRATGLYENDNTVVSRTDNIYMFTVFFLTPDDQIRKDYEEILKTVRFQSPSSPSDRP